MNAIPTAVAPGIRDSSPIRQPPAFRILNILPAPLALIG